MDFISRTVNALASRILPVSLLSSLHEVVAGVHVVSLLLSTLVAGVLRVELAVAVVLAALVVVIVELVFLVELILVVLVVVAWKNVGELRESFSGLLVPLLGCTSGTVTFVVGPAIIVLRSFILSTDLTGPGGHL